MLRVIGLKLRLGANISSFSAQIPYFSVLVTIIMQVLAGRLEVYVDGQWGTICNRSWTVQLALLACNQLGLVLDPENSEYWRTYPAPGELPMVMDNIRCEEREYDITRCRHDGVNHNIAASCPKTAVVGSFPQWYLAAYSFTRCGIDMKNSA